MKFFVGKRTTLNCLLRRLRFLLQLRWWNHSMWEVFLMYVLLT